MSISIQSDNRINTAKNRTQKYTNVQATIDTGVSVNVVKKQKEAKNFGM